ncbi:basic proline-rich protein-like [Passer montanus]|uniref:basic proline-rich protein-like n=1 Tax=Passer montanus TaxID=9160 RepID=UPI00196201CF|nr:basic proline-rich protein-like [Passer montanus]
MRQLAQVPALQQKVHRNFCCLARKFLKIPSITALKLAEPPLTHFDNDNSQLQLLSIQLFSQVMELGVEEGEEPLTRILSQSLLPLFLRLARGQGPSRSTALCRMLPEEDGPGGAADEVRPEPGKDSPAAPAAGWRSPLAPVLSVGGWQLCPCPAPHPGPPACAPHAAPCPGPCGPARPVPGLGSARPRGRACAGPSLPALPAAVSGPEPSGRAPALRPAAPAEPAEAPARDGRQHHRGGRSS